MDPLAADSPSSLDPSLVRTGRIVVGLASRAASWVDVASGGSGDTKVPLAIDVGIGAAAVTADTVAGVARFGWRATSQVRAVVARPPLVPSAYQPATIAAGLAERGARFREASELAADAASRVLVTRLVSAVLDLLDLTAVVRQRVDLDALVAGVDVGAVIRSLDLTRIVLDGVDLDAIVASVDLDAIVATVDIDGIVATVDLEAILSRVDVNQIADRVQIQPVIDRIDLVGLAKYVIDEIDLPEIIRESTGGVASEAVRGARMQSIDADQAVQRTIDRILLRRKARATEAPGGGHLELGEQIEGSEPPVEEHQPIGAGTGK